jgi:hypothetical protein
MTQSGHGASNFISCSATIGCGIGGTMRRREFITLLGGVAVIGTSAARAQQTKMPVIGYLSGWSAGGAPEYLNYFRQGLAETGFVEGRNCRCRDSDLTPDQIVDEFCHLLELARRIAVFDCDRQIAWP